MISSTRLGISITGDTIHLSLVSRQFNKFRILDLFSVSDRQQKPLPEIKNEVTAFLKKNQVKDSPAVLIIPRHETVMRHLSLPLDAEENLSKVVEYQLVNFLPAEDAAVAYDYSAARTNTTPPGLNVLVFLVLRTVVDGYIQTCDGLGIQIDQIIPAGVGIANYFTMLPAHFKVKTALFVLEQNRRCEAVGLVNHRLVVWRESVLSEGERLIGCLKTEVEYFRGQARLSDDAQLDVFTTTDLTSVEIADTELLNIKLHVLFQPASLGLGIGTQVIASRQVQENFSSLAAAVSGFRRQTSLAINLLPSERRIQRSRWQLAPTYALLGVNALLILALILRGSIQGSFFSSQLGQEISRLEPEVKKVRALEERMNQLQRRTGLLQTYRRVNPEVLTALNELSIILPKDTFVVDLTLKNNVIEISGISDSAAALPQILDNSPYFKEAEFAAAITRSALGNGKEGYRIRMKREKSALSELGVQEKDTSSATVKATKPGGTGTGKQR